jgi:hypothetical protein
LSYKNNKAMNLLNFVSQFPDEANCKAKWKEYRDKKGVTCPRCGSKAHYWKSDKVCYEWNQRRNHNVNWVIPPVIRYGGCCINYS